MTRVPNLIIFYFFLDGEETSQKEKRPKIKSFSFVILHIICFRTTKYNNHDKNK